MMSTTSKKGCKIRNMADLEDLEDLESERLKRQAQHIEYVSEKSASISRSFFGNLEQVFRITVS